MPAKHPQTQARIALYSVILILIATDPVAAAHGSLPCSVPSALTPLFDLLHTLTSVLFLGGVGLATLGFTSAGILIAGPFGEDYSEKGKRLVKQVFIGTTLLLSAQMIVSFLVSELGGSICS